MRGPARCYGIGEVRRPTRLRYGATEMPDDFAEIIAVAASFCSEACLLAGRQNIQIHGGIGFTWEHPAHLYYKRAKSSEFLFGDVTYHREILATQIGL